MLPICSCIESAFIFVKETCQFSELPVECNGRKITVIIQNISVCAIIISVISAIFSAIVLSPPHFIVSVTVLVLSFAASYFLKEWLAPSDPPTKEQLETWKSTRVSVIEELNPKGDEKFQSKLVDEVRAHYFPDTVTEETNENIQKEEEIPKPFEMPEEKRNEIRENVKQAKIKYNKYKEFFSKRADPNWLEAYNQKALTEVKPWDKPYFDLKDRFN